MALTLRPQLLVMGGWGEPSPPPLAFDFLGGEGYEAARKQGKISGVTRVGSRSTGDTGPDTRPFILTPYTALSTINTRASWTLTRGAPGNSAKLKASPVGFGGGGILSFTDNTTTNEWEFTSVPAFTANEGFGINAFISDVDSGSNTTSARGHVWYARWGQPGRGWKLQVKDGSIELLHLSPDWNAADEHTLHLLWQSNEPTSLEQATMQSLEASLYDVSEGLSFEGGFGRDEWRGALWSLIILPEPRGESESGAVHLMLSGGGVASVDLGSQGDFLDSDGIAHVPVGDLWDISTLAVGATGGAADWQVLRVRFNEEGGLQWGPYKTLYDTQNLGDLQTFLQVTGDSEFVSATLEQEDIDLLRFRFLATLSTTDARYTPWVHLLSARLEEGPRSNADDDEVRLDTLGLDDDAQPTKSVSLRVGEDGTRSADILIRDVNGKTLGGLALDDLTGHVATLKLGVAAWITGGNIPRGAHNKIKKVAEIPDSGTPLRGGQWISKGESDIEATIDDGTWLCNDTKCRPPLIFDGLFLGEAIRRDLRRAGYTDAEIAGVPSEIGPLIPRPRPGNGWSLVSDESCTIWSSITNKLDRFGAGLRFYRSRAGVWTLEVPPTDIKYEFTSNGLKNDPALLRVMSGGTRSIELDPLVWRIDNDNYYTRFKVIGGKAGQTIERQFVNKAAVTLLAGGLTHPRYRGHHKDYETLIDEGLDTVAMVTYALQSQFWRYGRPGRITNFKTFLHEDLLPYDRVTIDGITAEVISWDGTIEAANPDFMQLNLREVV